ncbi:MAG: DUF2807 domain-containing protein, partial [Bacteroidota bacterium]
MNKLDQTFAQLKQLPPELSEQQVLDMIKGLPALPAPKSNWFSQLSFNPIIMNSITLLVVASTIALFMQPDKVEETQLPQNQLTQVVSPESEGVESVAELSALNTSDVNPDITPPEVTSNTQLATSAEPIQPKEPKAPMVLQEDLNPDTERSQTTITQDNEPAKSEPKIQSFNTLESGPSLLTESNSEINFPKSNPITNTASDKKEKRKNKRTKVKPIKDKTQKRTKSRRDGKIKDKVKPLKRGNADLKLPRKTEKITRRNYQLKCNEPFPKHDDLRGLKSRLKTELRKQNLFNSDISLHRISFTNQNILVNRKALSNNQEVRIRRILKDYDIFPCDVRIVEITDEYIAAGDITPDGFSGHMTGRAELDLIGKLPITELRPQSGPLQKETRKIGAFHSLVTNGLAVVYLSPGESDEAEINVSGMPMEDLITKVVDGVLTITTRGQHNGESIKVNISAKALKSITVGGASELYSRGPIESDDLQIQLDDVGSAWLEVNTDT